MPSIDLPSNPDSARLSAPTTTAVQEKYPPGTGFRRDTALGRLLRRFSPTPAQAEILAKVKFPCC